MHSKRTILLYLKLPGLGKLESRETSPISGKLNLPSLRDNNGQLTNAYSVTISLVIKNYDIWPSRCINTVKKTVNATDGRLEHVIDLESCICWIILPRFPWRTFVNICFALVSQGRDHIQNLECSELFLYDDELKVLEKREHSWPWERWISVVWGYD